MTAAAAAIGKGRGSLTSFSLESEHIPDTYPGRKESQTEKILKNQRKVRLRK